MTVRCISFLLQISSLDKGNLPVGMWSLLCTNASLIVPNLSYEDLMAMSRVMVATFDNIELGNHNQSQITHALISSNHFREITILQSAISVAMFEALLTKTTVKPRLEILWKVMHRYTIYMCL